MTGAESTIGVLVMAHGTPRQPSEIAPFYTRIRRGRPPAPEQLEELERRYAAIGGLSPLTERTEAQVVALRAALERRVAGPRYVVAYGAKHTAPFVEDGVTALTDQGVRQIIGLVLTPHGSTMGSGEYFERAAAAAPDGVRVTPIDHWFDDPAFVTVMAGRVTDALDATVDQERQPVVFTAHSLPERVREAGDTYVEQMEASAALVAREAGLTRWQVAWQSAGRTPEPWLGPDIRDVVRQLAEVGDVDRAVVCPIGFVADHLEVLFDIDVELAAVADAVGLTVVRTASLNDDPAFIAALGGIVVAATRER